MSEPASTGPPAWAPSAVGSVYRTGDATAADLLSGRAWHGLVESLSRAGTLLDDVGNPPEGGPAPTPADAVAGYRHLLVLLALGIDEALRPSDPYAPYIGPGNVDNALKWGMDCPDAAYLGASIRGDATYRVWGQRGTVRYLGLQVMGGMTASANVVVDDLDVADDGHFELWLSQAPQPGRQWLPLDDAASSLVVRQFFYDWLAEEPAQLQIECVERPSAAAPSPADPDEGPPPAGLARQPPPPAGLARQLSALGQFVCASQEFWSSMQQELETQAPNAFREPAARTDIGGAAENVTVWGSWALGPEEALVMEVVPPEAQYWSVSIGNQWWETVDYAGHQSSLNGHQAVLDADGVFRAVISRADPGVANWLDPGGCSRGPMIFRWLRAAEAPVPTTRVVPVRDLPNVLPTTTASVDAAARAGTLAARRAGVLRRFGR